jgi:hypothetical protein
MSQCTPPAQQQYNKKIKIYKNKIQLELCLKLWGRVLDKNIKPGLVAHICNPSTREAKAEG